MALSLFFVFWVVEGIRAIFVLLSLITRIHIISILHSLLCLNELFGIACVVTLHAYRFDFAGRYCACKSANDYCNQDNLNDSTRVGFLVRRGRMLLALAITYWIFFAFNLCMHTVSIRPKPAVVA